MEDILSIMLKAKSSEHGVEVNASDSELFQRRFHAARNAQRKLGNKFYDTLRCRIVTAHSVYLINKTEGDAE